MKKRAASEAHRYCSDSKSTVDSSAASTDFDDDSSVWFGGSSSSPLLRCNKVFSDRFPTISRPFKTPSPTTPTLRQIAAVAVSVAEANVPARRGSRPRSTPSQSKPSKHKLSLSSFCKSSSTGAIAAPFPSVLSSLSALSSDSSLEPSLSLDSSPDLPSQSGVVFSPRHAPDREGETESWSHSRRHLAIPRGKVESVQRSVPTRLPRTRVFIQRSKSGHNALKQQNMLKCPSATGRTISIDPRLQTCRRTGERAAALAEVEDSACTSEPEAEGQLQNRASFRSKSVSAQCCVDDPYADEALTLEEAANMDTDVEIDTDVEMLDVGTSRMLSVGSYEIQRQNRSAVMAFRQAVDNGDVLLESSASLLRLRPYIRMQPSEPKEPVPLDFSLDDEFSARVRAHASLTALDGSPRRVDEPRSLDEPRSMDGMSLLGRRRGLRASGSIFSGSQKIRPVIVDEEPRGARRKLKRVARRLFRRSGNRDSRKEPTLEESGFDVSSNKMGPSSGDGDNEDSSPRQASDMYMDFMKDAAEREVRTSQLACLPKVMARAHMRVKPRRPTPRPVLNIHTFAELAS